MQKFQRHLNNVCCVCLAKQAPIKIKHLCRKFKNSVSSYDLISLYTEQITFNRGHFNNWDKNGELELDDL